MEVLMSCTLNIFSGKREPGKGRRGTEVNNLLFPINSSHLV